MKKLLCTLTLAAITYNTAVLANEIHPYVGLDYSAIYYKFTQTSSKTMVADYREAGAPYIGLQITPYFGVALGYYQTTVETKHHLFNGGINADSEFYGFSGDLMAQYPLMSDGKVKLLGSAGVMRSRVKVKYYGESLEIKQSVYDTALRAGIGFQYQINDHLGVRIMEHYAATHFNNPEYTQGNGTDYMLSTDLGLNYLF